MAVKKPSRHRLMTTMGTMREEDSNDEDAYLTSDDDGMYLDEQDLKSDEAPKEEPIVPPTKTEDPQKEEIWETEEVAPKKIKKKKKKLGKSERDSGSASVRSTASSKKGKKKKRKAERASGASTATAGSTGSKTGKKKKKKKKREESEELKVSKPKKKGSSMKDRIRASLAMIGDRTRVSPKSGSAEISLEEQVIAAIAEDEYSEALEQHVELVEVSLVPVKANTVNDRNGMTLEHESAEHMLEEEKQKTQQLESRVVELERTLQENTNLMMKVQTLEDEIERKDDALAKMAAQLKEVLQRPTSQATQRTASMRSFNLSSTNIGLEDDEQEYDDTMSVTNGTNLQGEVLELRSSLSHKDTTIEEQAKEIVKLKEQLAQSRQAQKAEPPKQVQATGEDVGDKSKQLQSEVHHLKQQLAEVEAARQEEIINVERLKELDAKKTEALKQAEEEKDEALRKLETHLLLNLNTTKPRESMINNVLDIGAPAQYRTLVDAAIPEESEDEEVEDGDELVPEKKNWFGLGGDDSKNQSKGKEGENEKKNWFGFGGSDGEDSPGEEEDSGWFGFGKKEKGEELLAA